MPSTTHSVQSLFDLSNRVALVTGGTGYLGTALTEALAEAGARVVVTSRDQGRADHAARRLSQRGEVIHKGVVLDHLSSQSIKSCVESVTMEFGNIDILVNNCIDYVAADTFTCTGDDFDRQLSNATGYFLLARMVRDHAAASQRPASIVMIGSMYGMVASYPEVYDGVSTSSPASYHALKGGIIHLTRHLAVYWARDRIRVNTISPGPFPGPKAPERLVKRLEAKSPMGRIGLPHELKGAIVFLASEASSYVTGQNLVVDGGWTSW